MHHPQQCVSLPSIHEMFPDYLSLSDRPPPPPPSSATPRTTAPNAFSFDVLRSDPTTSSLEHISSSTTLSKRGATSAPQFPSSAGVAIGSTPAFKVTAFPHLLQHPSGTLPPSTAHRRRDVSTGSRTATSCATLMFPVSGTASSQIDESNAADKLSSNAPSTAHARIEITSGDDDRPAPSPTTVKGKKHECSICFKRFNRPSSLRIHVNTHTGATPFRCPHLGCGREFNVNSNMRRHYRNHTLPSLGRSPLHHNSSQQARPLARARRRFSRSPGSSEATGQTHSEDEEEDELNSDCDECEDDEDRLSSKAETGSPFVPQGHTYRSGATSFGLSRKRSADGGRICMTSTACI